MSISYGEDSRATVVAANDGENIIEGTMNGGMLWGDGGREEVVESAEFLGEHYNTVLFGLVVDKSLRVSDVLMREHIRCTALTGFQQLRVGQ